MSVPMEDFETLQNTYAVRDRKSFKLNRVSRSSLNAETQATAKAADAPLVRWDPQ